MIKISVLLFLCFSECFCSDLGTSKEELLNTIERGFNEYIETKIRPPYLNEVLQEFKLPNFFRDNIEVGNVLLNEVHAQDDKTLCSLCNVAANFISLERKTGMGREQIKSEMVALCDLLKIESNRVCNGFLDINVDIFLHVLDHLDNPGRICDIVLQNNNCNFTNTEWSIDVPKGQSPSRPAPGGASTFRILQVTDVHVDRMYFIGQSKKCNEPLCCQFDQEVGKEGEACGWWGEYGSDIYEDTIRAMIDFAKTLKFDYVYFTGDVVSHRVWDTTVESNSASIQLVYKYLKEGFEVPVYPTVGNHETAPLNQFASVDNIPSNISTKWLFDLMDSEWSDKLPDEAMETIAKAGYYTVSPRDGFRLIVLNSNVAVTQCWWLLENDKDPYEQLDWLMSILSQAEEKGESVHILTHVPAGDSDLSKIWSREYNKIVNRFANTITGQFNGHTHFDQFQVFFNESNPDQAINVAWNGASLTPYDHGNPSFKIYTVDDTTFNIVDVEEYTFDLTKENLRWAETNADPNWYKLYSFRDAYNVPTLQPKDLGDLVLKMASNHSILIDYHIFRYRNSDVAMDAGCNEDCQKKYLCEIATTIPGNTAKCEYLKTIYDQN